MYVTPTTTVQKEVEVSFLWTIIKLTNRRGPPKPILYSSCPQKKKTFSPPEKVPTTRTQEIWSVAWKRYSLWNHHTTFSYNQNEKILKGRKKKTKCQRQKQRALAKILILGFHKVAVALPPPPTLNFLRLATMKWKSIWKSCKNI